MCPAEIQTLVQEPVEAAAELRPLVRVALHLLSPPYLRTIRSMCCSGKDMESRSGEPSNQQPTHHLKKEVLYIGLDVHCELSPQAVGEIDCR